MALPTDPLFSSQWHLDSASGYDINVTGVWDDYTGAGVTISVFDTGIDATHTDLDDNYDYVNQYSTVTQTADGQPVLAEDNHGTAVAGLIGAERNGSGVVGVAYDASLVSIYDPLTFSGAAERMELGYAHAAGSDVSNHSWGFGNAFFQTPDAAFMDDFNSAEYADAAAGLQSAVETGRGGLGTIFVQSAGNGREVGDNVNLHNAQNSRYTATVAATEQDGDITTYSTEGAAVMIAAPGSPLAGTIATTDRTGSAGYDSGDYTSSFNGTSAAAPIVSGVVALMLEANPNLGWRDVQEILVYSARNSDPGSGSWQTNGAGDWNGGGLTMSHDFGAGLIDAHAAVRLAEVWTTQKTSANEQSVSGSASPSVAIPDGGGASSYATSTINMGGGLSIDHVEVDLNISHTWIGDLYVTLTSPDGTTSVLIDRPGQRADWVYGSSQDNVDFTFSSTQHWGEDGTGTWTLQVHDYVGDDAGVLNDWTLRLFGDTATADDSYIYTDQYGSFTGDAGRKTLSDTGGTDTINAAAVSTAVAIDLAAGGASTIAGNMLTIAAGTAIENALGGDGADTLIGNTGNNALSGGRGDDTLEGGAGADVLTGGAGLDTASYASSDAGVSVDLNTGSGSGGDAAGDILTGIEDIVGSAFNDSLKAGAGANSLSGGDGNDWLTGGAGADVLDGGAGTDWVSYSGSASSVTVSLATGTGTGGDAEGDTLTDIENVWGSSHDDTFIGDGGNNWFFGGAGAGIADTASYAGAASGVTVNLRLGIGQGDDAEGDSFAGMEHVRATAHADHLIGNDAGNWLYGAEGDDLLEGGAGIDAITYSMSATWVGVDLANGTGWNGDARYDTYANVENAYGSDHNDHLRGDDGANFLAGGLGNDWFRGRGGADTLHGGGSDWASYEDSAAGVTVNLVDRSGTGGDAEGDSLYDIENLWGSAHDDSFIGDAGADTFDGGAGTDTASYAGSAAGVTVNLALGTGQGGDAQNDSFAQVESVRASSHDDVLTGTDGYNWLYGAEGDDVLEGGAWGDGLDGGAGNDTASYAGSAVWVGVDLALGNGWNGDSLNDTLTGIENLSGSAFDDFLRGDAGVNVLTGGGGIDYLTGRGGADILQGGDGTDWVTYEGSALGVTVNLATGLGSGGDAEGDQLFSITNLWGSDHDDHLTGDDASNWFNGAGGDVVSYKHSGAGVMVDLHGGIGSGGEAEGDTYASIEHIRAGAHDDTLIGNAAGNWLCGAGGNDVITGGGGNDNVMGLSGDDLFHFARGDGDDLLDNRGWAGDADRLLFGDTIAHDQLWLSQTGSDLMIDVIGEDGSVRVMDWFSGSDNTVATIEAGDGLTLEATRVASLVNAMAAFAPPTGLDEIMEQSVRDALAMDLAAAWQ